MIKDANQEDMDFFGLDGYEIAPSLPVPKAKTNRVSALFESLWHSLDLITEYRFTRHHLFSNYKTGKEGKRRWRMDYMVLGTDTAIEIHGGVFGKMMRHTSGAGFVGDREKMNAATILGLSVFELPEKLITQPYIDKMVIHAAKSYCEEKAEEQLKGGFHKELMGYKGVIRGQ